MPLAPFFLPLECMWLDAMVCPVRFGCAQGGLMDQNSNPGSATPETLHRIYKDRAAVTANPFVLRDVQASHGITLASTVGASSALKDAELQRLLSTTTASTSATPLQSLATRAPAAPFGAGSAGAGPKHVSMTQTPRRLGERRGDSPPKGRFRVINEGKRTAPMTLQPTTAGLQLTLKSLDMKSITQK